jgi:hypothetical protein
MYGYTNQYGSEIMEYPPITKQLHGAGIQKSHSESHSITITHAVRSESCSLFYEQGNTTGGHTSLVDEYQPLCTQHELDSPLYS